MTGERVARRYPASAFPEISRVRLTPGEMVTTLVNLSATGILVECASRPQMGSQLTVHFEGTFIPASIRARVVRCEVAGIASDGSLRFRLGLAFTQRIALPNDVEDTHGPRAVEEAEPELVAAGVSAGVSAVMASVSTPILRNRW
ncbi:MAG: PilZ domain-containing protein [Rhodospirillaceae bacterium]